jgi:hydroxymethylpyrimidine/phosphomethylpyrimidine kinase
MHIPNVLSIAGSDPSGGAGIQADLKTFSALGVYSMAAITALTAQNTQGVSGLQEVPPEFVQAQLDAIFTDIRVDAVKIGMLGNAEIINVVANILERYHPQNIVLDPVMVATSGDSLISAGAADVMKVRLIPLCDVLTPNIPEAEKLSRKAVIDMERSARDLLELGCGAVLIKGGHLKGDEALDMLSYGDQCLTLHAPRIETQNTHGTGCTLSSALAAYLAKGLPFPDAARAAIEYLNAALTAADMLDVGHGHGPVHHLCNIKGMHHS